MRSRIRNVPNAASRWKTVGKEFVRDELVYVPSRLFVRKHYAEVVKCPACGEDESQDANYADVPAPVFRKAAIPAPMIPHSFCSPELLAHILYEKYVMAVPLERQAKDFKAMGMRLSTATLSNWVIHAAENFMKLIYERMKAELLNCSVIHADETVVQVLNEPNKKARTDSENAGYTVRANTRDTVTYFLSIHLRGTEIAQGNFSAIIPAILFATVTTATIS